MVEKTKFMTDKAKKKDNGETLEPGHVSGVRKSDRGGRGSDHG